MDKQTAKIIGSATLLASIQASIGSVEMSSKFSVVNFAKDQDTLQRAADALRNYVIIGLLWAVGTSLVSYAEYNGKGALATAVANLGLMGWIVGSYTQAFKEAAKRYNLQEPNLFGSLDYTSGHDGAATPSWLPYPIGDSTRTYPLENRGTASPHHPFVSNLDDWKPHPYVPTARYPISQRYRSVR